jgi:hypothetical protein
MARSLQAIFEDARTDSDPDKGQNTGYVGPTVGNAREQNDLDKFSPAKQQEFIKNNPIIGQGSGAPSPLQPAATSPVAPAQPSPVDALIKKQQESEAKVQANEDKIQENLDKAEAEKAKAEVDTAKKMGEIELKKGLLKAPTFQEIPYKSPRPTSPAEQWGSIAMLFAMLGSMFTRRPATTALNAAAAAMNGFNQRDEAAAKQSLEEWKVANSNMLKAVEFQQRAYEDALKGYDSEEKLLEIAGTKKEKEIDASVKALNSALQHTNLETVRNESGLLGVVKLLDQEKQNLVKGQEWETKFKAQEADKKAALEEKDKIAEARLAELTRANDARIAQEQARTKKLETETKAKEDIKELLGSKKYIEASPEKRALMVDQINGNTKASDAYEKAQAQLKRGGKVQPEEVDAIAEAMANFDYPIPTGTKMAGDPNLRAAVEKASKLHPNLMADSVARQRDLTDIESGRTSLTLKALDVADNHIQSFLNALKNKPSAGDVAALNSWASVLGKSVNSPEQATYATVAEVVANEVVKAVQGTGTTGALADREALRKIFSNGLDEKGGAAVAEALNDLLYGQRFGIAQEKGRFFTPEQIFGNKQGAALRAYAEGRGGFDTFPSNAYQHPGKTLEEMRPTVYGDNPPPAAEKELGPADFKTAKDYIAQFRKDHPGQEKNYPDADLIEYYNTENAGKK